MLFFTLKIIFDRILKVKKIEMCMIIGPLSIETGYAYCASKKITMYRIHNNKDNYKFILILTRSSAIVFKVLFLSFLYSFVK